MNKDEAFKFLNRVHDHIRLSDWDIDVRFRSCSVVFELSQGLWWECWCDAA